MACIKLNVDRGQAVPRCLNASDNASHVCKAICLGGALRSALAQAISLTNLLRPQRRLSPYQSGYETWVLSRTLREINRMEPKCC